MHPRERLAYSSIDHRPPLQLPDDARLVVWPLLALEEWDMARPMARMVITPPQGQPMLPDHPNWSWHEYGMRVGFWRLKRMFERLRISPTVTLNARVCETYPQVVQACIDNGYELNAHGYDQVPMHKLDRVGAVRTAANHHPGRIVDGCSAGISLIGWAGGDEALLELANGLARYCGNVRP
jgi:allantoinase